MIKQYLSTWIVLSKKSMSVLAIIGIVFALILLVISYVEDARA